MKKRKEIFSKFAKYYDLIYSDKDYKKDSEFVQSIIKKYYKSDKRIEILDVGCGSGGHAIILGQKGYRVTGMDLSSEMVAKAKEKAKNLDIDFCVSDMTDFHFAQKYDVAVSLFCSMGYLNREVDMQKALQCIRNTLRPGGLLVFDFWNSIAVISQGPSTKVKNISYGKGNKIVRIATPDLDLANQVCRIKYHCLIIEKDKLVDEFEEIHPLHFYSPFEIALLLKNCGFKDVKIVTFGDLNFRLNPQNWYLAAIAKT